MAPPLMPRVTIKVSCIPSMVIGIVLRKKIIFILWNCCVSRCLEAALLSSLICIFPFHEISCLLGKMYLVKESLVPRPRNYSRYSDYFEGPTYGEIAWSGGQSDSLLSGVDRRLHVECGKKQESQCLEATRARKETFAPENTTVVAVLSSQKKALPPSGSE